MKLIVAEKPSVGSSIAKVVGANTKENGCISGNGYIVSWCVGHLVGLCNADDYDPKYQKWDIKDLPIIPTTWKTKVLKNTTKQFAILKKLMNDKRVDELICATDAGREGELIFKLVYDKIGSKKPVKRLWISSMEDKAIKKGMQNLKDASFYHNTYLSAMARAKSDWLIGINATRFYSCLYNNKLRSVNVGRVMSPTLAMIVKRYQENTNFTSVPFFNIVAKNKDLEIKSIEKWDKKEDANNILSKISNSKLICTRKDIKQKEARSPLPYDLTTLQREANRMYGLSAQKTLDIVQGLYEAKQVTYPRTDSSYLTEDMEEMVKEIVKASNIDIKNMNIKKICNNKKVSDHHAIIPTLSSTKEKRNSNSDKDKIYNLILGKLLCSVSDNGLDEKGVYDFSADNINFRLNTSKRVIAGYRELEEEFFGKKTQDTIESNMPIEINENDALNVVYDITEGKTTPPKLFTEDTLLSAMERAGNEELDNNLDTEKSGIGTPATRSSIIEKLIKINYIKRARKNLVPTEAGIAVDSIIADELKDVKLTADWENKLTLISLGKYSDKEFIKNTEELISKIIKNTKREEIKGMEQKVIGICPRCGNEITLNGQVYECVNNCGWKVFKNNYWWNKKKVKLTDEIMSELLAKGKVHITGFHSEKKNASYDADVVLDDTGEYINFKLVFEKGER